MQELRPAIFALRAFNVETGLITDIVSEPSLRQIRFQWWRDGINSLLTDKPVKHPVIEALSQVNFECLTSCQTFHLSSMSTVLLVLTFLLSLC